MSLIRKGRCCLVVLLTAGFVVPVVYGRLDHIVESVKQSIAQADREFDESKEGTEHNRLSNANTRVRAKQALPNASAEPNTPAARVEVIQGGESHLPARKCRKMIVGPWINQPDPFEGYGGFVGWETPVRLRNGKMYVSFSAGYWHGSPPTPLTSSFIETLRRYEYPTDFSAPRGGRAMICESTDNGVTWSKPRTLLDTPCDDRHPAITELSNGILICSLFTYCGRNRQEDKTVTDPAEIEGIAIVRSLDGGRTWQTGPQPVPPALAGYRTDGPAIELADKSVLLSGYGKSKASSRWITGVFKSADSGLTWRALSTIEANYSMEEPAMVRLKDGRLVMITRPEGAITWSSDSGRTWTPPATFGFRMYAPALIVLDDATLLCHFGSYTKEHGGLRAIFSTDGGKTWLAPAKDYGFLIDQSYGYSRSCIMPDGSAYLAYIGTGGHRRKDAQNNMIWSIRLRVRTDHSGIELLPVDNGP